MRSYIPTSVTTVEEVAMHADSALRSIYNLAKNGVIPNEIKSRERSQLFDDNGTLKFYSAVTGSITDIT